MNFSQDGYFLVVFMKIVYFSCCCSCCCWEIGGLMNMNIGEITGLSKDVISSKKNKKNKWNTCKCL